jgi:hypothetical protein
MLDFTVAVLERVAPEALFTWTVTVAEYVALGPSRVMAHCTVPELPDAGAVHAPVPALSLTNVVPAGSGSMIFTFTAASGPLLEPRS